MVVRACQYSDFAKFYPTQYFYCTYDEIKIKMDNGHFYVVKDNGKIIGCGGIAAYWDSLTESWIHTVFVAPEYQRKGVGRKIIEFLENDGEVTEFLDHCYSLVDASAARYIERGFTNLMVSFGCTGGQHRSVYCAQHMAEHIAKKFNIKVELIHREQDIQQTFNIKE